MRLFFLSIVIILPAVLQAQAQTQPPAKPVVDPTKLAIEWVDRLNELDDWQASADGKEEGLGQVLDRFMELFTPDVLADVPPHDEDQLGPVMLLGQAEVRRWAEKFARTNIKLNYIVRRQTEKEFEGEYLVYSKALPWGGLGISFPIIAGYSLRKDGKRYLEQGAVFIEYRENGKNTRFRLLQSQKDEVVEF
jgi:hypothetical protein